MYFCIQTYAIHFRDLIWNFSTFLTDNPVTQALTIPTMFVFSFQPEWKFLGGKDGNYILVVFYTHQVLCPAGEFYHYVKKLVPNAIPCPHYRKLVISIILPSVHGFIHWTSQS